MIFQNFAEIKKYGFTGFKSVYELLNDSSVIPKTKGVYVVINPTPQKVEFLEKGVGGFFKEKNPNVSINELKEKWINNSDVIYIGQCGGGTSNATLKSRLSQYLNFGKSKNVGHYGGRFIWQLKIHKDIIFAWKELPNDKPSIIEQALF